MLLGDDVSGSACAHDVVLPEHLAAYVVLNSTREL